jgi:broad specificity phosphatase PhoE
VSKTLVALFLRHGSTEANEQNLYRSWGDWNLDDIGVAQAKAAAKFLKVYDIKHVVSSPLLRAFTTANIVTPTDVDIEQTRGLLPWHLGLFSGTSRDKNEEALHLFIANPEVTVPNGESLEAFENRQFTFFQNYLERARKVGLTLFVAHTSNAVALNNFLEGGDSIEPEVGEAVQPGGIGAIYYDGKQHYFETIFGEEKPAEFGGS